jgi:CheY-like chemotaxis protein
MADRPASADEGSRDTYRSLPKVLIVDDEEQVRTLVTWQLESENFEVYEASGGDAAL